MTLVEESVRPRIPTVAVLVFEGAEIIDFTGPWEVFGAAGFDVYAVGEKKAPLDTAMGMTIVPRYTFEDAPVPDVFVVPGGGIRGAMNDADTIRFITTTSHAAGHTLSVCNGAFLIAKAGLLDGLTATTTYGAIDDLQTQFPNIQVTSEARYVDNGRIVTTAGLSSGIDGALHVIEKVKGRGAAQKAALSTEYAWDPNAGFVRAQLADAQLPKLGDAELGASSEVTQTAGTRNEWSLELRTHTKKSPDAILDAVERSVTPRGWTRTSGSDHERRGTLRGTDGSPSNVTMSVVPDPSNAAGLVVRLHTERATIK